MQWPPLPAHVKAVLNFGIQVPFQHSSHICVKFFWHSSPVPTQMCTCYGSLSVEAKGVTFERVHTDMGLYMCVHIIQRYDDAMKEKGGEGRERKERDIYI